MPWPLALVVELLVCLSHEDDARPVVHRRAQRRRARRYAADGMPLPPRDAAGLAARAAFEGGLLPEAPDGLVREAHVDLVRARGELRVKGGRSGSGLELRLGLRLG